MNTNLEESKLYGFQPEVFQKTERYEEAPNPQISDPADMPLVRSLPTDRAYSF